MPSQLHDLNAIFNSRVFRVPDYQRGYAWKTEHLEDFWDDLSRLEEGRSHYTGQLTLEQVPDDAWRRWDEDMWLIEGKGYKPFYIVDGQQRLITAIILIKCLLERVPANGQIAFTEKRDCEQKYLVQSSGISRAYLFGYEKDNPSYEYLKTKILGEPSVQFQGTETTYTANLLNAQAFFSEKLKDKADADIQRWFKAITQRFLFNVYELEKEMDEFVVFETMNNRGKPLSKLELLKNRLIYLSTLLPGDPGSEDKKTLRKNVNDAWKTVFEFLGREKAPAPVLEDDDFLRAHWIMYFPDSKDEAGKKEDAGKFGDSLLRKEFTADRIRPGGLTPEDLQRYVASIQQSVRKWHGIYFPHQSAEVDKGNVLPWLDRLDRLGRGAFEPVIMAAMQKTGSVTQLSEFLSAAERFIFVVARLCHRRADTGDNACYRLAGLLFSGNQTLAEVTQSVDESTKNYFSLKRIETEMGELFQRWDGFYSWEGLRYFLFEYEQNLREEAGMGATRLNWSDLKASKKDYVTIEHIYPVSPREAEWQAFKAHSQKEPGRLRNSLGNLLALSQIRNSKFSNRSFAAKKQDSDGVSGYFNGSYSEISVAQLPDWTPSTVLERGLKMLDFLESRWRVPLGSRAERVRLLGLEFLEPDSTRTQPERADNS